MHRRDRFVPALGQERRVQVFGMAMDHIELVCPLPHPVEHQQVMRHRILDAAVAR